MKTITTREYDDEGNLINEVTVTQDEPIGRLRITDWSMGEGYTAGYVLDSYGAIHRQSVED